jgi:hypothetical protein
MADHIVYFEAHILPMWLKEYPAQKSHVYHLSLSPIAKNERLR